MPISHIRSVVSTSRVFFVGLLLVSLTAVPLAGAAAISTTLTDGQQPAVATNLGVFGGDTWDIAVDGDYVYTVASGVPNGFFYSSDAGDIWDQPAGLNDYGSGQGVDVDITTGYVYVSLGGDLYKSTDHGATLTLVTTNAGNPLLAAKGMIMGGFNNLLKVSADNGATFAEVAVGADSITSLAASPTAGQFFAVTRNGDTGAANLYRSLDSGLSWTALVVTPAADFTTIHTNPYNTLNFTIGNDHHLWQTLDGGTTFAEVLNAGASCNAITAWSFAGRMYACNSYSIDHGATWTAMDYTGLMRGPGKTIVVDPYNSSVLYGDGMGGVAKSVNGGATWKYSYDGITGVNILAISVTNDKSVAWVSSGNGLGKSTDFNSSEPSWEWPILPCAAGRCDSSGIGATIWVKPDDPTIVLAGSIGGYIYRSTDGGTTWSLADLSVISVTKFIDPDTGMNIMRPTQIISDPAKPSTVYATMSGPITSTTTTSWLGAVLKSTDSGDTWTDVAITADAPANSIAVSKTGELYVGVGSSNSSVKGLYKYSADAWTVLTGIPTDVNINSIVVDPENQSMVYATAAGDSRLGHDGFYKSIDSGASWGKVAGLTDYYNFTGITIQRNTSPNTLYVTVRDRAWHGIILKSSNAGETWGVLYTGLKSETFNSVIFDGLLAGSKHGIISLKSRAAYVKIKASATTINKNKSITLTSTLKDAATKKLLKGKTVGLYQLVSNKWKLVGVLKTDKNKATIKITFKPKKTAKYRLTWTPNKGDRAEYAVLNSKTFNITVKK